MTASITGLIPNTLYHFRVRGNQAAGTINGADLTFTTLPVPAPTVTGNAATNISSTGATLNGLVNPNGIGVSATATFEYGPTAAYGLTMTASQSPVTGNTASTVSANISGLAPATLYHFHVKSTNVAGTTNSTDLTFTTLTDLPTVTTASAANITKTAAQLNGNVTANGLSSAVTFQYGLTSAYGSTMTAAQSPVTGNVSTPVSATVSGLALNTLYHYRAVAVNSAGTTNGADLTFMSLPNPPTVTTNAASTITGTGVTLNATVNPSGSSSSIHSNTVRQPVTDR